MAITVGPFTNVPAPGDPIRSPWAQQLTRYVVNVPFAWVNAAAQISVPPNTNTTITLTGAAAATDPYTMVNAGGLIVPTGYGGLWAVDASFIIGSHGSLKTCAVWVAVGANRYGQGQVVSNATEGQIANVAAICLATAGQTIAFAAFQGNSSAQLVGVQLLSAAYLGGTGGAPQ